MSGSFTQKNLIVQIRLGQGTFGNTGQNTVELSNLRVMATITKGTFPSLDIATIRVYGLTPTIMNACSTMGTPLPLYRIGNTVTLLAGSQGSAMSVVFSGFMGFCWQDYNEAPEVSLVISGLAGGLAAIKPVPPISYPGGADVATIMAGIATTMNMGFENNGVVQTLTDTYEGQTALEQAHSVARHARINMYIDTIIQNGQETGLSAGVLAIWPELGSRSGPIPTISAATGMVGYPKYQSNGMAFTTLYNPNIRVGGKIQMQSTVGGAASAQGEIGGPNGLWLVQSFGGAPLVHELSSQLPGGPWFTHCNCIRVPGQL